MKNRVLLAMLIIFIVLSSIWITCGTIFVVREIEVIDTSELLTQEEKNQIAKDSGLYGKNILFNINEEKIAQGIKSSNPTVKLQSVKAEFPSRVILKVARSLLVYYDSKNGICLDADMCVVDMCVVEEQPNCIDIAKTNLNLAVESLKLGDVVLGKDAKTQCKIKQLKIVANYFSTLSDFDMKQFKIAYNDAPECVGPYLVCLTITVKTNVEFEIKILPSDDFLKALQFTVQIFNKTGNVEGEYATMFDKAKKVVTKIGDKEYREE